MHEMSLMAKLKMRIRKPASAADNRAITGPGLSKSKTSA